jgi:hypothetical protein
MTATLVSVAMFQKVFIGGYGLPTPNPTDWYWVSTNQNTSYTRWASNEPNQLLFEFCIGLQSNNNKNNTWINSQCVYVYSYICERR